MREAPDATALLSSLGRIRAARLRVTARAIDAIDAGEFPGSALRGGLLTALLDVGCVVTHRECGACTLLQDCAVPRITGEAAAVEPTSRSRPHRPYRLFAPFSAVDRGAEFGFGVDLFGEAADRAALAVGAIARLAERGIGRRRGRFEVVAIGRAEAD